LAAELAFQASTIYGRSSGRERGAFLRKIAANIEALTEELVERAHLETALPTPDLQGETGRTCGQLRLFVQVVEEGSWTGAAH
jgi:2,5-dioxopentanoate dehydrogenase